MNITDKLFGKWSTLTGGLESKALVDEHNFTQALAEYKKHVIEEYEKSQWHDLVKNPEDLPLPVKEIRSVLIKGKTSGEVAAIYLVPEMGKEWFVKTFIAWRELPKWEKE